MPPADTEASDTPKATCLRPGVTMLLAGVLLGSAGCAGERQPYIFIHEGSPDGRVEAEVRLAPCGQGWCQSLWVGLSGGDRTRVAELPEAGERSDEIAWTKDGTRVAFLVNGTQLRMYETGSGAPAGLLDLLPADGPPSTRVARGVTFSDTGAAITFDDCPRDRSGCRPGMVAMR